MNIRIMTDFYCSIIRELKELFEIGRIANDNGTSVRYDRVLQQMQRYLVRHPDEKERHQWQTEINATEGYPLNYDFDYGGHGPAHIRRAFVFN